MAKRAVVRKVVKWGGLVASALLAVAWVGSCWFLVGWDTLSRVCVDIRHGTLNVAISPLPYELAEDGAWSTQRLDGEMQWCITQDDRNGWRETAVPLWIPLLIMAGATAAAWRADARERRRQRVGSCPACGYDRRGLEVGKVCPECGAAGTNGQMVK